jgi:hypothetical protein
MQCGRGIRISLGETVDENVEAVIVHQRPRGISLLVVRQQHIMN